MHISDKSRISLAHTLLEKEARKLFLGLPAEAWPAIDHSMRKWASNPLDFHLEDDGPRDFWDSFAAFMESIKLKPNFTAWITAENVHWQKMTVPVAELQMTSPLAQLYKIPELNIRHDLPVAELLHALSLHPEALPEQKRLIDKHSTDPAQDAYPIIVHDTNDGLRKIMDGNRRTLKAVIYGTSEIDAWVGKVDGLHPVNFWVPVNDMFQLVKVFKEATEAGDEQLQQAVARVLKARFEASKVAEQAYLNRIANQSEIAKSLYEMARGSY